MGKKVGYIVAGGLLIAVFLAWMLVKGTPAVQSWLDTSSVLGFVVWGGALACLLGGAALTARGAFKKQ